MVLYKGKVRWKVRDDEGRIVVIADNNAYYAPEAPYRLLCPHSWRETQNEIKVQEGDESGDQANLMIAPDGKGYLLFWNHGKTVVTASLDETTNLPMIATEGVYSTFSSLVSKFQAFPVLIPDLEEEEENNYTEVSDTNDDTSIR